MQGWNQESQGTVGTKIDEKYKRKERYSTGTFFKRNRPKCVLPQINKKEAIATTKTFDIQTQKVKVHLLVPY